MGKAAAVLAVLACLLAAFITPSAHADAALVGDLRVGHQLLEAPVHGPL